MTVRLLLVEPSATMRHVLEKHARELGYSVESTPDYTRAEGLLERQYRVYGQDFDALLFGWPSVNQASAASLAVQLESSLLSDLPVLVFSTDMRAETRAWVAGRSHTDLLSWKDYNALAERLTALMESAARQSQAPGDWVPAAGDAGSPNGDIHILVVDDSPTIRKSLTDLLELQGYRVDVAADPEGALAAARETPYDIAILDYYLDESTGDTLCRDLVVDPACGDVVCAVLTGTYADHIIKRSLRAGAVECMFKNESSELLLSRIDAIARFVRQRRALRVERERLAHVIDLIGGAALVLDHERRIRYLSSRARELLGVDEANALFGRMAASTFSMAEIPAPSGGSVNGAEPGNAGAQASERETLTRLESWTGLDGRVLEVTASWHTVAETDDLIVEFRPSLASASGTGEDGSAPRTLAEQAEETSRRLGYRGQSRAFLERLERTRRNVDAGGSRASLLLIDLWQRKGDEPDDTGVPVSERRELADALEDAMRRYYRRTHHVARLSHNRYGVLLVHDTEPKAYLMTRKLLQRCNAQSLAPSGARIASTGSLLSVSNHADQTSEALLITAGKGLDVVNQRGLDQALIFDLKRMLPVYPPDD